MGNSNSGVDHQRGDVESRPGTEDGSTVLFNDRDRIKGLTRLITAETKKKKLVKKDQYDYNKENMQLLKHMFKRMDPAVMLTSAERPHGEVQLSFKYDVRREVLLVKVIRARDLAAKDLRGKTADPYVKLHIYPMEEGSPVHQTQVVKKSIHPVYHEIFSFNVQDQQLEEGRLIAQVWDADIMENDDFIGEAIIPFSTFDFEAQPVHTAWYTLRNETDLGITGDLDVSLTFTPPSTLSVTVHGANNLTNHYTEDGAPNAFVKIQIPGLQKVHKTQVKENTVNPEWEETFDFPVPPEEFSQRYFILHVVDYEAEGSNDSLGQVIVDLVNFDPENGFRGTLELADLKNSDRLRSKWFQERTAQEFRESLIAHAAARNPKFLFQQHSGTKVIRVSTRKAGASAKLHIVNGIPVY